MKKKITFLFAMLAGLVTTAMADNVISADPLRIMQKGTAELTIKLQSTEVVRGLQFTLTLPEGVTVEESDEGIEGQDYKPANNVKVSTIDKVTDGWWALGNDVSTSENPRTYKFVMLDPSGNGIEALGDATAILKIYFTAADDATVATTNVTISDIHMSVANSTADETQNNTTGSVTVSEFLKGDADGDGEVTISDAVSILRVSVGKTVPGFVKAAGDVNGNDEIDMEDAVTVLRYSVGKINALSRRLYDDSDLDLYDPD